ncbi:MAG: hypothetical protein E2O71_10635 [Deltaproteobacteria bacterium]|nr:MAG: hypothetical protein E2O71_10635 [Deltaproteobacteria bacterium]
MPPFSYVGAVLPVREDLPATHRRAWRRLAEPGTWWTGRERVAIAAEVRRAARCGYCRARKVALSPNAVEGAHQSLGALPEAVVEVIHRVVTDPARLSRSWYEKLRADGVTDAHYVETIGVIVTVVSIDSFHRGLGVPPEPLPEPLAGEPSRRRPPAAKLDQAWVPMLAEGQATDPEARTFMRRRNPNVLRALSLVPDEVRGLRELSAAQYLPLEQLLNLRAGRSLRRVQMELIAGRVSALNECFY